MITLFAVFFHNSLDYQLLEWVEGGGDVETFLEEPSDLVLQEMG